MRKFYLFVLGVIVVCLSSCVDIEERYDFKPDGSCNVVYGFDMGSAISVLKNLMTDSVKETPQFSLVKDTTVNFYTALPDSTQQKMTTEDVNMAKSSDLSVKMNLRKNIMKVSVNHYSKNSSDLVYYLKHLSNMSMSSQLNAVTNSKKQPAGFDAQQLIAGEDYYLYEITPHKFYRIIDKEKFNAFLKKTQSTFSMAKAMLIDMPYKIVLNFTKPLKRINNSKALVSADRKHVTLITNMDDVMKNPSIMNLKIDF
jgi:hypothetical protein